MLKLDRDCGLVEWVVRPLELDAPGDRSLISVVYQASTKFLRPCWFFCGVLCFAEFDCTTTCAEKSIGHKGDLQRSASCCVYRIYQISMVASGRTTLNE
jgi:hypothetical protein